MADKLKLMLVDDHYLVRMGLASIMALETDVVVCRALRQTWWSAATFVRPVPAGWASRGAGETVILAGAARLQVQLQPAQARRGAEFVALVERL